MTQHKRNEGKIYRWYVRDVLLVVTAAVVITVAFFASITWFVSGLG